MITRNWIGILLILFGLGFLFQQLNLFDFSNIISTWWPLILIIIGGIQIFSNPRGTSLSGLFFILLGAILLGNQFIEVNLFTYLWPLFLILIGLIFIFSRNQKDGLEHSQNTIKNFSLFGGNNIRSNTENFEGGEVTAIFGGAEIDLRNVTINKDAHLEIICIFGGVTVIVPENINIEISGVPIFGGWENKTRPPSKRSDLPILYIKCYPIFGGAEIKD